MITMEPVLVRPTSLAAAALALAEPGALALAGGTDVMNGLRLGHIAPSTIVDLQGVAELGELSDGDPIVLGAGVTMRRFLAETALARRLPAVADAAMLLGGRQIQASATFGGNLCNASPAAETATPLLVSGAQAVVHGASGLRTMPLAELWTAPRRTSLQPGELLVALHLPAGGDATTGSAYRRLELRRSVDIALVSASAWLVAVDGVVTEARVAIGAVSPVPMLVPEAAGVLRGVHVADAGALERAAREAGQVCSDVSRPISDVRSSASYRQAMVTKVVQRAVHAAVARMAE